MRKPIFALVAFFAAKTALAFEVVALVDSLDFAKNFDIADMKSQFIVEGIISLLVAVLLFFKPVETLVKVVQVLAILFILKYTIHIGG